MEESEEEMSVVEDKSVIEENHIEVEQKVNIIICYYYVDYHLKVTSRF